MNGRGLGRRLGSQSSHKHRQAADWLHTPASCAGLVATLRADSLTDWITINTAVADNTALPALLLTSDLRSGVQQCSNAVQRPEKAGQHKPQDGRLHISGEGKPTYYVRRYSIGQPGHLF